MSDIHIVVEVVVIQWFWALYELYTCLIGIPLWRFVIAWLIKHLHQRISTVMWDELKSRFLLAVGYNLFKYDSHKRASWRVTGMEMFWIFLFGLILVTCSNIANPYPFTRLYYIDHKILLHETIAWMPMATKLLELWHDIWRICRRCSKKLEFYEQQFQPTRKIQNLRRLIWKYPKCVSEAPETIGAIGKTWIGLECVWTFGGKLLKWIQKMKKYKI